MIRSLLYASVQTFTPAEADPIIDEIITVARARNAELMVTGALIATEDHFAQLIEGPPAAIDALMDSIRRDPRHRDVTVLITEDRDDRRFGDWSLAYNGASRYFEGFIAPLITRTDVGSGEVARLTDLLTRLAAIPEPRLRSGSAEHA